MKTIKALVDSYIESEDGGIRHSIIGLSGEALDKVKQDIKDYESTAKGVLFARLMERGVLKRIERETNAEGALLQVDHSELNGYFTLLDGIMDDSCERSEYYFFKPKTEEDIKDMSIYAKLKYSYCSGIDGNDNPYWRGTGKIEAGKTYIYQDSTECEFSRFISLDKLEKRVSEMCKYLTKLSKD